MDNLRVPCLDCDDSIVTEERIVCLRYTSASFLCEDMQEWAELFAEVLENDEKTGD